MIEKYFPLKFKSAIKRAELKEGLTEVRVRVKKPIIFKYGNFAEISDDITERKDIDEIISYMSLSSLYAYKDEMKMGYITLCGGHRAGLCGKCVEKQGEGTFIKDITSINIRIAREIDGVSFKFISKMIDKNVLVISPPGCGKTTFLRDSAKYLSKMGYNVGIVDERCEISPYSEQKFVFDLGINTDVLSGYNKADGMIMMLRTMNPDIIITDEIATFDDFSAVLKIINSGVKVIASFHGGSILEYKNKLKLMGVNDDYFDTKIILNKDYGAELC